MASSSSASPSTSASSSQVWKYHVFLSFRGEDTRQNFVGHLYKDLVRAGIHTYKDDETLPRGESISPALLKAIEDSQLAVIVFSKNYADSSWCLEELTHIMECKETRGQTVIPIFYGVDPSHVRNHKEEYGEALAEHELKNKNKRKYDEAFAKDELENKSRVESWRKALTDASNISGWSIANRDESKAIEEIVMRISQTLHPTSVVDGNLVGMKDRVQHLILKLQIGLGGVRMIGIWGVGGGGKTTLASSIYDEIRSMFDGCCFIKNVREESSNKDGLEKLQEKVLCCVSEQKQMKVGRVDEGRSMIKDRLHHRKVLIVLDDVDSLEQLEELAGSRDWFGQGSRIIITTRDQHVLTGHKVDVIHDLTLLNNDEAMQLFCKQAPRGDRCMEEYELLSKEVVSYADGLPLALRVLGRFLKGQEMKVWRSALDRLRDSPDDKIQGVLKISFDGLKPMERELFLDISCFFKGEYYKNKEMLMRLDACGFHPVIGIKVLVQKALITISERGEFEMHDLVEEMAHYIVRGEHPNNPAKHTRVWKREDVRTICAMDATENLDNIKAISLRWSDKAQRVLHVAANMKKLRLIHLEMPLSFEVSHKAFIVLPDIFPPKELCFLSLSSIHTKQLWEGYKFLPNLRMIKLQDLSKLMKTPDVEGLPNLETFMVEHCELLEEIDPSFGHLEKLLHVVIQFCDNLKMLPPITRSKKLETLLLGNCREVFTSSKIQQNMGNSLPHKMKHIGQWFFSGCLRKLDLWGCNLTDGDISSLAVWEFPNLQQLNLSYNEFVRLSFSRLRLPRLKWLDVSYNKRLVELSELPPSIAVVKADGCDSLESCGDISNCKWLWNVSVEQNNKLGPRIGDKLLNSMLQGNARDYFINISLSDIDIWRGCSVPWVDWVGYTYNMQLPHDWYNHFSGICIFINCESLYMGSEEFDIIMKQGVEEDFHPQLGQESNETVSGAHYEDTHVGYVSFSSLRHTACLNSTYNIISFSMDEDDECRFSAVLVPKDDPMQTTKAATDFSQFWDEEDNNGRKTFDIQHESNSSIKIRWRPIY